MNYLFFLIPFLAYCAEMPTEQGAYPQQFSRDTLTNTDTYAFNVFRWDSIINSGNDTLYLFGPLSQMPDCAIGKVCIECTNIAGTQNCGLYAAPRLAVGVRASRVIYILNSKK